ncbi:unnamed protein product [Blepharisma stoltei]|uniref:Uncharacterized protein n=1 Tax=Blepharisma stoltei TaxID=1481888 RepID=A0AAU9IMY3_9CILI|nr:unnamed protein product [Blepharisma stoltei]
MERLLNIKNHFECENSLEDIGYTILNHSIPDQKTSFSNNHPHLGFHQCQHFHVYCPSHFKGPLVAYIDPDSHKSDTKQYHEALIDGEILITQIPSDVIEVHVPSGRCIVIHPKLTHHIKLLY